jgi:hypothetical protein
MKEEQDIHKSTKQSPSHTGSKQLHALVFVYKKSQYYLLVHGDARK